MKIDREQLVRMQELSTRYPAVWAQIDAGLGQDAKVFFATADVDGLEVGAATRLLKSLLDSVPRGASVDAAYIGWQASIEKLDERLTRIDGGQVVNVEALTALAANLRSLVDVLLQRPEDDSWRKTVASAANRIALFGATGSKVQQLQARLTAALARPGLSTAERAVLETISIPSELPNGPVVFANALAAVKLFFGV